MSDARAYSGSGGPTPGLSPLKQALLAIDDLQARLVAEERARTESIAVIGIGCRFAGGVEDAESFWRLLRDGVEAVREVPAERWDVEPVYDPDPDAPGKTYARRAGFLDQVDHFDPQFFGISPREAQAMDPQQRLLLEVTWEALEHAGQAPDRLGGSAVGVFVGIASSDYAALQIKTQELSRFGAYYGSGIAHSVAAGRISYVLGLQGPAVSIDTACSSSLVAVHLACQSLRADECRMALAGGVNVILSPENGISFAKSRMLAAGGHCRTFDAGADGFVDGEGCGVVVLKRLSQAQADGDRVIAVIAGSAINQDGASSGLTAPSGSAQVAVIREALRRARVAPAEVDYVEAHGTGTSLGDPIEVQALGAALADGRPADRPVLIGSLKPNIGHAEAAAGVAGLIKVVLAIEHGVIPPQINFERPSPHIPWDELPVRVVAGRTPWPDVSRPRVAGVSSFGFSGTNAHVIVQAAPAPQGTRPPSNDDRPAQLLTLSARSDAALAELAARVVRRLADEPSLALRDVAFSANVGRASLAHRAAIRATTLDEARQAVAALAVDKEAPGLIKGRVSGPDAPRVAFLFTGQGSQYAGMGRALYDTEPTFRRALDRCAELLDPVLDRPLLSVLFDHAADTLLDQTAYTQPAIFALQHALGELWRAWGVEPGAVLGHSVGEYAAACAAGAITLEEGCRLIAARGRLMQSLPAGGAMAAVFASEGRVAAAVSAAGGRVSLAAVNGPEHMVVSGDDQAVYAVIAALAAEGVRAQRLSVSHAFHSPLMEPILDAFGGIARTLAPTRPRISWVSNVTGAVVATAGEIDAAYWRRHAREPVRFAGGIQALWDQGYRVFVEIGPGTTLVGMGRATMPAGDGTWLASLRRSRPDWDQVLETLAALWTLGVPVDWTGFHREQSHRRVVLPSSPFERARYWLDLPRSPAAPARAREAGSSHPLLGQRLRSALTAIQFEAEIAADAPAYLGDHRVHDLTVLPATAYLEMCLAAAATLGGERRDVVDLTLQEAMVLPDAGARTIQVVVTPDGADASVRVFSLEPGEAATWRLHASGGLRVANDVAPRAAAPLTEVLARCDEEVGVEAFYAALERRGLDIGPAFHGLDRLRRRDGEAVGQIRLADGLDASPYQAHPALLDACLQIIAAALASPEAGGDPGTFMPIALDRLAAHGPVRTGMWSHVRLRPREGPDTLVADVSVVAVDGAVILELEGLRFARAAASTLRRDGSGQIESWLYEVEWRPAPLPAPAAFAVPALHGLGSLRIAEALEGVGAALAEPDAERRGYDEMLREIDQLAVDYIVAAVRKLGSQLVIGDQLTLPGLQASLGVIPRYQRLLGRLLDILAEDGILVATADGWTVVSDVGSGAAEIEAGARSLHSRYGDSAELALVTRCGPELASVLQGATDPLDLLFPGGSLDLARRLYRGSPAAKACNMLVCDAISRLLAAAGGRRLRILEVGGGTGGTTAGLLPLLAPDRTEYLFTDVSPVFVAEAGEAFGAYPFVSVQPLDIERSPAAQGLAGQTFDVILSANALHATSDLRRTLAHCRELLAPDGLLLLVEVTTPQRWVDLTFGLTEGWWKFTDDLRTSYPLLSREGWMGLLASAGLRDPLALPYQPDPAGIFASNAVIMARADAPPSTARADSWLILADQNGIGRALAAELRTRHAECVLVEAGDCYTASSDGTIRLDPNDPAQLARLMRDLVAGAASPCRGIVHLWALDAPLSHAAAAAELAESQRQICGSVLHLVQAVIGAGLAPVPRMWVATREAQYVGVETAPLAVAAAPVLGLCRSIRAEHPELRCTAVDLESASTDDTLCALAAALTGGDQEEEMAIRGGVRHVPRLVRRRAKGQDTRPPASPGPQRIEILAPGILDTVGYRPVTRDAPGRGEVEIEVRATGLNFRDLLNALGMRNDPQLMGGECAGTVARLGDGVTGLQVGDEVVALTTGAFGTYAIARAELVLPRPAHLTAEEAATLPIAFMTAHHCLHRIGSLGAGDRVLIHAAAGGVGLAAVQLAQRTGAEVFATAGRPEKRDYLHAIGIRHVMDSRTPAFAAEVMACTGGRGVDLVLNSLSGELIRASLSVLASGGRFVEIGKSDILDADTAARLRPDVAYAAIDLEPMLEGRVAGARALLVATMAAVNARALRPLPHRVFPATEAAAAFRHMAQARHIGKIVISAPGVIHAGMRNALPQPLVRADATYLITGGFGGLGLEVARWLVRHGARRLVLMGRRGPDADGRAAIEAMEHAGAEMIAVRGDVCDPGDVAAALADTRASKQPLRGVIHAAGVLDDGVLLEQRWTRFESVLGPKVTGAWHLHTMTLEEPLDFFVLFSSAASLLGSPGQGNHAAANAFLDALAHHRRARGLPALSINWGAWSGVGAATRGEVDRRIARLGLGTIPVAAGLDALEQAILGGEIQLGVLPIDWSRYLGDGAHRRPFLSELERPAPGAPARAARGGAVAAPLRRELRDADTARQLELLAAHVGQQALKVLGLEGAASIDPRRPLRELGLDSLMAVELRNLLKNDLELDQPLPATLVFDHPTVEAMTRYLGRVVLRLPDDAPTPILEPNAGEAIDRIENLSDEEVDRLLAERMRSEI